MNVNGLSHVAIAVRDIKSTLQLLSQLLGAPTSEVEVLKSQGVRYAFISLPNVKIELISPIDDKANLNKFLDKRGEGLHHLSFSVSDLKQTLGELASDGVQLIDESPRTGAEGKSVAFLHPKSTGGVLIELEEE